MSKMDEPIHICAPPIIEYTNANGDCTAKLCNWFAETLQQHENTQVKLDLQSLQGCKRIFEWDSICHSLSKLLLKPSIQEIMVPQCLYHLIIGKCKKAILDCICDRIPNSRSFTIEDSTVDLRRMIEVSQTNKIRAVSSPGNDCFVNPHIATTISVLQKMCTSVKLPDIHLKTTIAKAYKRVRKIEHLTTKLKKLKGYTNEEAESNSHCSRNSNNSKHFKCYICKTTWSKPKNKSRLGEAQKQYPRLCKPCAEINFQNRIVSTNLKNKYALVTGGRIKIGYQIVLKLLRDGCNVITTSRFPRNAAKAYSQEKDYDAWKDNLRIYPLDLKDITGIYKFISYVKATFPYLDILINNAAQTLRRPIEFYRDIIDYECIPFLHLPPNQQCTMTTQESLNYGIHGTAKSKTSHLLPEASEKLCIDSNNHENVSEDDAHTTVRTSFAVEINDDSDSAEQEPCSKRQKTAHMPNITIGEVASNEQTPLTSYRVEEPTDNKVKRANSIPSDPSKGDIEASTSAEGITAQKPDLKRSMSYGPLRTTSSFAGSCSNATGYNFEMGRFFPRGLYDDDGQQLDLRRTNSWRQVLEDVPLAEFMEVLVVNTIAPFILNKELKSLMKKRKDDRKFIVNVSAMEGQFNRETKNKFHPHTNMAKAALNMMTRTSALEYKEAGIYMTSVDTGWVSDERPFFLAKREKEERAFVLPLDCIDGAARVYNPIVSGYNNKDAEPHFAVFLKDYKPYPW